MKPALHLPALLTILIALMTVSCVSPGTRATGKNSIACPDCQVVFTERLDDTNESEPITIRHREHICPGCKGRVATLLSEGAFQHRCSICESSPYSCRIANL